MYVSPAFSAPRFFERKDRRGSERSSYPVVVQLDGRPVPGRDISKTGLSVLLPAPAIGDVVHVTLAPDGNGSGERTTRARVVRVSAGPYGYVLGLEFID